MPDAGPYGEPEAFARGAAARRPPMIVPTEAAAPIVDAVVDEALPVVAEVAGGIGSGSPKRGDGIGFCKDAAAAARLYAARLSL